MSESNQSAPVDDGQRLTPAVNPSNPDRGEPVAWRPTTKEELSKFIHNYDRFLADYIAANLLHHFVIAPKSEVAKMMLPAHPPVSAEREALEKALEAFADLQRRLMSYCNHANAGHMPSDAREFARRIILGFAAAYEQAGIAAPKIEPETAEEYRAALSSTDGRSSAGESASDILARIVNARSSDPATDDLTVPLAIELAEAQAEIARLRSAGQSDRPDDVQDTYLIGGPPDLRAMSGSVESDRIIQLHFRRRATDDDRKWLLDAINAKLLADREGPHIPVGCVKWPDAKVTNPDIADPTGVPYLDCLIHRVLDAQQDINFAANEQMSQSLCDAASLLDEVEAALRTAACRTPAECETSDWDLTREPTK